MADTGSTSILTRVRNIFTGDNATESLDNKFFSGSRSSPFSQFFGSDVFNEERMTPHNEMLRVREMIDNNAFIASGLSTYQSIFLGENVTVESDDPATEEFFNEEWLPQSGLLDAIGDGGAGEHFKGIGNAYYHVRRGQATGIPKKVELVSKPENMWIRKDDQGNVKDYVLEIPREIRDSDGDDAAGGFQDKQVSTFQVSYGGTTRRSVTGVRFDRDEIIHVPQGRGQVPPYGRSDLASASSDEKILREIERSYGVMARHKQVPKQVFMFYQETGDGSRVPLDSETWEKDVLPQMNNLADDENPMFNANFNVDVEDYSYGGAEIKMQETIDYLKRKITSPVLPQFMMHGDMTTNAVSNDQLAVFFQEVRGDRHTHVEVFKPLLEEVAEKKGLNGNVTLSFGDLSLTTEQSRKERIVSMWNDGLLTLNEARERLGLPESDAFGEDPFKFEVQSQPNPPTPESLTKELRDAASEG